MTGLDVYTYFLERIQHAYTGSLGTPAANRLFQQALYQAAEIRYRTLVEQRQYDEINPLITTEAIFTPINNQITTNSTGIINDYQHLLTIKQKYTLPLYITLSAATNANPIVITVNERGNLRTYDNVEIAGVIGNPAANGIFFLKKLSDFRFALYSDITLQTPVAGTGAYISGGTVSRIYYKYAKLQRSNEKIGVLATATVEYPKFENTQNLIKLYPTTPICTEITIDYINKAPVLIDVSNNVIDLELTYPYNFLQFTIATAADIFSGQIKDEMQERTQEIDLSKSV